MNYKRENIKPILETTQSVIITDTQLVILNDVQQ